jgi:hypothetical protein
LIIIIIIIMCRPASHILSILYDSATFTLKDRLMGVLSAPTWPAADAQSRWQPGAGSLPEAAPPAHTKQQQQQQQQRQT